MLRPPLSEAAERGFGALCSALAVMLAGLSFCAALSMIGCVRNAAGQDFQNGARPGDLPGTPVGIPSKPLVYLLQENERPSYRLISSRDALNLGPHAQTHTCESIVRIWAGSNGGSGTVISNDNGRALVITAAHVTEHFQMPTVVTPRHGSYRGRLLNENRPVDLALIEVDLPPDLPAISVATQAPQIGERVTSAGYGGGDANLLRANNGVVQAYRPNQPGGRAVWFEIAGGSRSGDSGGPMFNERGELCGVLWGTGGPSPHTIGSHCLEVQAFVQQVQCPGGVCRPRPQPQYQPPSGQYGSPYGGALPDPFAGQGGNQAEDPYAGYGKCPPRYQPPRTRPTEPQPRTPELDTSKFALKEEVKQLGSDLNGKLDSAKAALESINKQLEQSASERTQDRERLQKLQQDGTDLRDAQRKAESERAARDSQHSSFRDEIHTKLRDFAKREEVQQVREDVRSAVASAVGSEVTKVAGPAIGSFAVTLLSAGGPVGVAVFAGLWVISRALKARAQKHGGAQGSLPGTFPETTASSSVSQDA